MFGSLHHSNRDSEKEITASPKEAARNWSKAALVEPEARRLRNSSRGFTGDPAKIHTAIISTKDGFTPALFP